METANPRATAPWRPVFADTLGKRYHGYRSRRRAARSAGVASGVRREHGVRGRLAAAHDRARRLPTPAFRASGRCNARTARGHAPRDFRTFAGHATVNDPCGRAPASADTGRGRRVMLVRQLLPAIAILHEKQPGMAHGAIAPERIVITADARVAVADHMLGSALEALHYTPDRIGKSCACRFPLLHRSCLINAPT